MSSLNGQEIEMAIPVGADLKCAEAILALHAQTYPHLRAIGAFGSELLANEEASAFSVFVLVEGDSLQVHSASGDNCALQFTYSQTERTCIYTAYLSKLASSPQLYTEAKVAVAREHPITGAFKEQVKEAFEEIRSAQPVASYLAYEAIHSRICTLVANASE